MASLRLGAFAALREKTLRVYPPMVAMLSETVLPDRCASASKPSLARWPIASVKAVARLRSVAPARAALPQLSLLLEELLLLSHRVLVRLSQRTSTLDRALEELTAAEVPSSLDHGDFSSASCVHTWTF